MHRQEKINDVIIGNTNPDDVSKKINKYDSGSFEARREKTYAAFAELEKSVNAYFTNNIFDNMFNLLSEKYGY